MNLYIGTSGFGYKEWKGKFYPAGIPAKDMLGFYAKLFNAVEVNNTFYRMPNESLLENWAKIVPPDFVFVVKAPRIITHIKRLRGAEDEAAFFLKTCERLGTRLGAVLFQLPPGYPRDTTVLEGFLDSLDFPSRVAFEFKNPTWHDPDVFEILRSRDCALCVSDTDEAKSADPVSTASWGYLRLRRTDYTEEELTGWVRAVRTQRWESAFIFFKHEDKAKGPEFASRFMEISKAAPGWHVPDPNT